MTMTHPERYDVAKHYRGIRQPAGRRHLHSYDINDMQRFGEQRVRDLGDSIYRDGDIVDGSGVVIEHTEGAPTSVVNIAAGRIYAGGIVFAVSAATLAVPRGGTVQIGLCVHERMVTYEQDPTLRGGVQGTDTYGQPGADRLEITVRWIVQGDACGGRFVGVYTLVDGEILRKDPPVTKIDESLARYDRERSGHYRVKGFVVTPLGYDAATQAQMFSISAGTVNVWGYKIDREFAQRLRVPEVPTLQLIDAEPHAAPSVIPAGGLRVLLNHGPVRQVLGVTILRGVAATATHGPYSGAVDALWHNGVAEIVSITQGATTYVSGTDYRLVGDGVDWSLPGAEPAPGSSYQIVYRYLDTLDPSELVAQDSASVTVADVTPTSTIIVRYTWALPRTDLIAIDRAGGLRHLPGTPARINPWPPVPSPDVFVLAVVDNRWGGMPSVRNTRSQALHNNQLVAMAERIEDLDDLIAQNRLRMDIANRQPAAARGTFVDPFRSDAMRDQGLAQTGAVFGGQLRLPIVGGPLDRLLGDAPVLLPFTDEIILTQDLETGSMRINEYQVFTPLPGTLALDPAVDFWTETATAWSSDVTRVFDLGARAGGGIETGETIENVGTASRAAETLRVRTVTFTIDGFGAGEMLDAITFDGVEIAL